MRLCVRDHRLDGSNVQVRADGRVRCLTCYRDWSRLRQRCLRLVTVIGRHHLTCTACQTSGACVTMVALENRLDTRQRAFDAWRALGKRTNHVDVSDAETP